MCMRMYVRKEMFNLTTHSTHFIYGYMGEREMFYLTTHSTHFIYGYMGEREMFYLTTHSTHFIYGYMGEREMFYLTTHSTHFIYGYMGEREMFYLTRERDVAQSIACPPLKRSVVGSILLSGPSCSLGYFSFQPVVHNWFIKGRGMYCSVYGKVHIKDPLLLIEKSSLCGGSGFQRDHMNDVQ